jgi:hypothetical protein
MVIVIIIINYFSSAEDQSQGVRHAMHDTLCKLFTTEVISKPMCILLNVNPTLIMTLTIFEQQGNMLSVYI